MLWPNFLSAVSLIFVMILNGRTCWICWKNSLWLQCIASLWTVAVQEAIVSFQLPLYIHWLQWEQCCTKCKAAELVGCVPSSECCGPFWRYLCADWTDSEVCCEPSVNRNGKWEAEECNNLSFSIAYFVSLLWNTDNTGMENGIVREIKIECYYI